MAERKVLNKYFPPDFDPSLIKRRKGVRDKQQVVRLMAPFSMRCNTCGEYIYKGKKFNARKETVENEDYYGIRIFRFYIKCILCSAEITFKTDPKNTDYKAEHGASRNFEPWREESEAKEIDKLAKMEEEENNPMKVLENRTTDSKREMEIFDALTDIRARNARNERIAASGNNALTTIELEEEIDEEEREKLLLEEEDERLVREVFSKLPVASSSTLRLPTGAAESSGVDGEPEMITVKRKAVDDNEPTLLDLLPEATRAMVTSKASAPPMSTVKRKKPDLKNSLGIKIGSKAKGKLLIK